MQNGEKNETCACKNQNDCTKSKEQCDCKEYCSLHARTMAEYVTPYYVTVSPDMRQHNTIQSVIEEWHESFYKLRRNIKGCVIVLEMAGGIRPHFHMVLDVTNQIGMTKTLFGWSKYNNVKKHNKFVNGYHYLFKEVNTTRDITGIDPIITYKQIRQKETDRILQRSLQRLKDKCPTDEKLYPKWMVDNVEQESVGG